MRKFFGPTGSISRLLIDSEVLKGNILGDPTTRAVDIYVPAGHDGQGLPLLVDCPAHERLYLFRIGPNHLAIALLMSYREFFRNVARLAFAPDLYTRQMTVCLSKILWFGIYLIHAQAGEKTSRRKQSGRVAPH